MTSKVAIRPARTADSAALGRLGALLVSVHYGFDAQRFIAPTPDTPSAYARFLESQLGKPVALVLVAEQAGTVVGYAYGAVEGTDFMTLRGPAGILYDLAVDPGCRRQGIGRALVEAAVAELQARGVPRILLSAAARNEVAQALFASAGFRRTMIEMTREVGETE